MSGVRYKHKFIPLKILASFLYSNPEWLDRDNTELAIRTGIATKKLGVTITKLKEAMEWLAQAGYIENLDIQYGRIEFSAVQPLIDWNPESEVEFELDHSPVREVDRAISEPEDTPLEFDPFRLN